jgi:hypothetical protein
MLAAHSSNQKAASHPPSHLHLGHPAVVAQLHGDDRHAHQLEDVVEKLRGPPGLQVVGGGGKEE